MLMVRIIWVSSLTPRMHYPRGRERESHRERERERERERARETERERDRGKDDAKSPRLEGGPGILAFGCTVDSDQ